MPTEPITVQYINQPKPGWKSGSIKAADGRFFSVAPECLGWFQVGSQYSIDYEQGISQKGNTWYKITAVDGQMLTALQPVGATAANLDPVKAAEVALAEARKQQSQKQQSAQKEQVRHQFDDLPPILSNVLAHAVSNGVKADQLPGFASRLAAAIQTFRNEMSNPGTQAGGQSGNREMGHGEPPAPPPLDDDVPF